jgi:hypothetical protein
MTNCTLVELAVFFSHPWLPCRRHEISPIFLLSLPYFALIQGYRVAGWMLQGMLRVERRIAEATRDREKCLAIAMGV